MTIDVTAFIETIIDASDPADAEALALQHPDVLAHPDFGNRLTELSNEEVRKHGKTRRFVALTRLALFVGAVIRNRFRAGIAPAEPLPDLVVIGDGSMDEFEDEDTQPDTFNAWRQTIETLRPSPTERPSGDGPLSDFDRARLSASIDDRMWRVSKAMFDGLISDQLVATLEEVIEDYDRLLQDRKKRRPRDSDELLERKKLDARRVRASVEATLGRSAAARAEYAEVAEGYRDLALSAEVVVCVSEIAAIELADGDGDAALNTLIALLDEVPPGSLDSAEVLVNLAAIHVEMRDDFAADERLESAQAIIDAARVSTSSGREYAQALTRTLISLGSPEGPPPEHSSFAKQQRVRTLHRHMTRLRERMARRRGDIAGADGYLRELNDVEGTLRDGSRVNADFSDEMLKGLDALLKKLDSPDGTE